jgi:hypothetical protein
MAAEMPLAAVLTIAHRLPVLGAAALRRPGRADGAELRRMVTEKAAAGRKASEALLGGAASSLTLLGASAWTPALPARMFGLWARTARASLAPAHRAVTGNAERLSKKRRRGG